MKIRIVHQRCGSDTDLSKEMAAEFEADPWGYAIAPCAACEDQFDVAEFYWAADGESLSPAFWSTEYQAIH